MKNLFTFFICLIATITLQAQTATLPSGSGTIGSPYQISSLENLYWIAASNAEVPSRNQASRWGAYYVQTANIDASATSGWFGGAGWRPIGYDDETHRGIPFTGSYNGQGHTISGLYINSSMNNIYQGFVGYIGSGTVSNLGLTSVNITGVYRTGGIAGGNDGTISDCYCSGSVTANNEFGWGGGIVGYINGTVTQCYFNGTVSGTGSMFGGVVAVSEGTISKCYNTGSVTGSNYVGGIVGYTLGRVSDCYNKGTISGSNDIGGIAGENDNTIDYCFNIGSVSGTGYNIGGIAGADGGGGTIYTSNFWDSESSGITQGAGWTISDSFGITGKTTAQMKSAGTFTTAGWDFSLSGDLWGINGTNNNGYPWLRFEGYTSSHIWLGNSSTLWGTATNWSEGSVPTSTTDVIIPDVTNDPIIGATTTANCNNLTVTGSLTIQSSASGIGSLIVSGTSTGTVNAERYMTGSKWHIVSPIAAGGSISTFIQAAGNAIPSKTGSYGMMDYNETTNAWKAYYTATTPDIMSAGKGYSMRRTSDGIVTFTGTLTSGTKTVPLTKGGDGWNCVGNPYSSAIYLNTAANATNNFLKTNAIDASKLDASYACIYVWDQDALGYKILGNSSFGVRDLGQDIFQSGQGFFVKANNGSSSIQFTPAMQVHSTGTILKSGQVSWPGFELIATAAQTKASTMVAFNNSMTKGLDPTYDAGLLRGTSGLELYSRLVDDNGVDFAIQCLPENYNSLVIPLGLDCKTGGEITFSAETVELPATCSVILEDKLAKTFTSLANGATYKTTVSAGATAVGRFYIHTSNSTTGTSELSSGAYSLKAYPANGQIWITGEVAFGAKASLFDVNGRDLGTFNLQEGSRNSISSAGLAPGVYLLNVTEASKKFNTKIVIY
jgi:hypothetical protein